MKKLLILFFIPCFAFGQVYEYQAKDYLDKNNLDPIEGIYTYMIEYNNANLGTVFIKKNGDYYEQYVLRKNSYLISGKAGQKNAVIYPYGTNTYKFTAGQTQQCVQMNSNILECMPPDGYKRLLIKSYTPKQKTITVTTKKNKTDEWQGNGSGLIISKNGYIITNYHVIEDFDDIEVEFIYNDEVQKFKAEVIQVDKINDLAILKIHDINFDGLKSINYNFNLSICDVGTKVYAFGYPMALSIMGKELKVTDGIISSKTGFDGDISTYQITAPLQSGSSGGPLFDDRGNLVGLNSSGIRKDLADNVGYTIKSTYVKNLIDVLPNSITLPSYKKLESLKLTDQIKEISKYVVLIKIK